MFMHASYSFHIFSYLLPLIKSVPIPIKIIKGNPQSYPRHSICSRWHALGSPLVSPLVGGPLAICWHLGARATRASSYRSLGCLPCFGECSVRWGILKEGNLAIIWTRSSLVTGPWWGLRQWSLPVEATPPRVVGCTSPKVPRLSRVPA